MSKKSGGKKYRRGKIRDVPTSMERSFNNWQRKHRRKSKPKP